MVIITRKPMRRSAHIFGGLLFGLFGYLVLVTIRSMDIPSLDIFTDLIGASMFFKTLLLLLFVSLGALLPDKLDPPFSPRHRKFAHSKILLFLFIGMTVITLYLLSTDKNIGLWSLYFFLLGYISHLILDSLTPAGLW